VIVGATGSLGTALCHRFAADGTRLGLVGRNSERTERLRSDLENEGCEAHTAMANLSAPSGAEHAVEDLASALDGVDVLVNAAGVGFRRGLDDASEAEWQESWAVNVAAPYFAARAAARHMERGGVIVNVASEMARLVSGESMLYPTTKAALAHLTGCLAAALAPRGIRVLGVSPGPFHSDLLDSAIAQAGMPIEEGRSQITDRVPLERIADAAEIAETIAFLASERAAYLTGTMVSIDGGTTLPIRRRV
jgi:NAD(P)-dependent dehydrogenase (short-subunit alcohol dehydrogenase family)